MSNVIKKEFNGIQIAFEGKEKISLTDLWKAAGETETQHPKFWLTQEETKRFTNTLAQSQKVTVDYLLKVKRGKGGGTWAHWQIALAYAKYLSPELHMFVNQCFKERLEEEQNPELAIARGHERAIKTWKKQGKSDEWIAARIRTINAAKFNSRVLKKHGDDNLVFPMCANAMNRRILGMDAKDYKEANGIPVRAATRDFLDDIQLAEIELASLVSSKRIKEDSIYGNQACASVHDIVAGRIHSAVNMRGV